MSEDEGIPIDADRSMTPEKALRWLLEFGSDWVKCSDLTDTWADEGVHWHTAGKQGYLEGQDITTSELRLTEKAIKLIGELKCTEANR